jgi:hypothetical protein
MTARTCHGSCHCGAVAFRARIDLAHGGSRCNCRYCRKTRNWSAQLAAPADLEVTAGAGSIVWYGRLGGGHMQHGFCRVCGIRLMSRGNIPELGGAFVSVMLSTLDDVTPQELIEAPLTWCDGANDAWWTPPVEVRHL